MTQKHLFLKNGLIIGEMDKRYDELMHLLWKNLHYISIIQVDLRDLSFAPKSVKTKQCVLVQLQSNEMAWASNDNYISKPHLMRVLWEKIHELMKGLVCS